MPRLHKTIPSEFGQTFQTHEQEKAILGLASEVKPTPLLIPNWARRETKS